MNDAGDPRKVVKPAQMRNGWNRVARDLDRAFGLLLGPHAFVLQQARELSWKAPTRRNPKPDAKPFRLRLGRMAKVSGFDRKTLRLAIRDWVEAGVLTVHQERPKLYHVGKDYPTWKHRKGRLKGKLLLTNSRVDWCLDAIRQSQNGVNTPHSSESQMGSTHPILDSQNGVNTPRGRGSTHPIEGGEHTPFCIEKHARGEFTSLERIRGEVAAGAAPAATGGAPGTVSAPPWWSDLCRTAGRLVRPEFAAELSKAPTDDGRVAAWLDRYPDRDVWEDALRDFAGERDKAPTLRRFVGFVKTAGQRGRVEASKAPTAEKPAPQPEYYRADPNRVRRRRRAGDTQPEGGAA